MKLVPMQRYRVELPRHKFQKPLTYMGLANGDYRCMVCEREGGTRAGWSNRHSFVEGDPDNPTDQVIVGTECIKKCKITPVAATEDVMGSKEDVCKDPGKRRRSGGRGRGLGIGRGRGPIGRMRTMEDVFETIDEAVARGKSEHTWKDERRKGSDHGTQRLYNKYGDVVAEVVWFDIDEGKDKFVASVATPGVRGNPTQIGRFTSLDKAKAAVEKELGL